MMKLGFIVWSPVPRCRDFLVLYERKISCLSSLSREAGFTGFYQFVQTSLLVRRVY